MKVKTYRPKIDKYNSLLSMVTRTPETPADWRKNFASAKVENDIANHEEWAREVLKAAGLPDSLRRVAVCKKKWEMAGTSQRPGA